LKKTNFQFYATHDEIRSFLDEVLSAKDAYIYLVRVYPEYAVLEVTQNQRCELGQWTFALFSACRRQINTKEEYSAHTRTSHGDLILYIGQETESELKESSIGASAEHSINPKWTSLIGRLKKNCIKGAYLVTPQNRRQYYPGIRYTQGAQAAWQKGKTIRPVAGWNRVELTSE